MTKKWAKQVQELWSVFCPVCEEDDFDVDEHHYHCLNCGSTFDVLLEEIVVGYENLERKEK